MDLGTLASLLASLVFLGLIVRSSAGWTRSRDWQLSWVLLIGTGIILTLGPPVWIRAAAWVGASSFAGLQLAGAYRFVGAPLPRWVFPLTALLAFSRTGLALSGFEDISHAGVLALELGMLGWSGRVILNGRAGRATERIDWLLVMCAAALCGLEALDAFNDLGKPTGSVTWAPWLLIGGMVAVIQTVGVSETMQRAAIQERREQEGRDHVAQRLESLGVLAGGIAHDFNNLLTGILGNLELASAELDEDHPAAESIANSMDGVLAAAELSGQMLSYASDRRIEPTTTDLGALVQARAALLRSSIGSGITLQIDAPSGLPFALVDASQISQVVMNLAINAGEACTEGPGTVRVAVGIATVDESSPPPTVGELTPGEYVCIVVSDTGTGLGNAEPSVVFDPFFTTKFSGRGLGLAVAQQVVRAHGGAISVASTDPGTRFEVFLPVADGQKVSEPKPQTPVLPAPACILVVDDDEQVLRVAASALRRAHHTVTACNGGNEAIEALNTPASQFELLLLDATMPDVSSGEVIAHVAAHWPQLPILMMTGHDTEELTRELPAPQIVGWVRKPFRIAALQDRVATALQGGFDTAP